MKSPLILIYMLAAFACAQPLAAQTVPDRVLYEELSPNDPIMQDLYVKLYLSRFERTVAEVERQKQVLILAIAIEERRETLLGRQAVTQSEWEDAVRNREVEALRLQDREAALQEARLLLDIAVDRVSIGVQMPICADLLR